MNTSKQPAIIKETFSYNDVKFDGYIVYETVNIYECPSTHSCKMFRAREKAIEYAKTIMNVYFVKGNLDRLFTVNGFFFMDTKDSELYEDLEVYEAIFVVPSIRHQPDTHYY